jgi:hypothetical protein
MIKYLIFSITAIFVLLFITGCPQNKVSVETRKQKPVAVEVAKDKTQTEPNKMEPKAVKTESAIPFYDKYAKFLAEYVDDNGMVNYDKLKHNRSNLNSLIKELADFNPKTYKAWPKEEKIAFWINAYNIQMLDIIVKNYPIESDRIRRVFWPPTSIRHINGIWDQNKFIIMDETFTLQEIDQRFFRAEFDEPRVFLAITHASLSSPSLRKEPYEGAKLDNQLDDQAKKFLSSSHGFSIDRTNKIVALSAIFQDSWHGKYFEKKYITDKKFKSYVPVERALLNFVSQYIPENDVSYLELENYTIGYIRYDWRLNDSSAN